jgi:hypothetical protein
MRSAEKRAVLRFYARRRADCRSAQGMVLCSRRVKLGSLVLATGKNGEHQKYVGLGMHSFRRSAIRNMTRQGLSTAIAMRVSGQSTRSTFDRYDVVEEQDLEHASQVIEKGGAVSRVETDTKTDASKYEHQ